MSTAVSAREGYDRWAATYPQSGGNPLMVAEQAAMLAAWPRVRGRQVLDLACGSGRYTQRLLADGARVVALDLSAAMLSRVTQAPRVCARMERMPFAAGTFEVIVCALALGHVPVLADWMREVARVLAPGGELLYSDFHPAAAQAGLTRSFSSDDNRSYTLPHHVHPLDAQRSAAAAAGLELTRFDELRVGFEVCAEFEGSVAFYQRWHGLPLVSVVRGRKRP